MDFKRLFNIFRGVNADVDTSDSPYESPQTESDFDADQFLPDPKGKRAYRRAYLKAIGVERPQDVGLLAVPIFLHLHGAKNQREAAKLVAEEAQAEYLKTIQEKPGL